jgi:acetolactate synthase-1/2/3 large subunit
VCLATLGPGATNLITGVADANLDKSPVVAITGQAGLKRIHKESHQYLNIVNMFRPITKWNARVSHPDVVAEIVRNAFKVAETEKPGSCHIELPEDVAELTTDRQPIATVRVRRPDPDKTALREAAMLIQRARRPLIIAGNGAIRKLASRHLREFTARYRIPVAHTFMGQGAISDDSPQSLHTIGLGLRDFVMDAVDAADLIVTVGYDIAEYAPEMWNPRNDRRIIHIDFSAAEVYTHYQPLVEVVADISATLRELNQVLDCSHCQFEADWFTPVQQRIRDDIAGYELQEGDAFTVPGTLNILRRVMGPDDLLISDVGSHKIWIARNFPTYTPNGCLISNGLASMGFALPGGVAAALQNPGRRIVAAMGDGGFLMNSQELETAKRLGVGFTVLVFNDNDYGLISWKQRKMHDHAVGTVLTNPDFKAYAESFGIAGFAPKSVRELEATLRRTIGSGELAVIEVPVDQRVNLELSRKLGARGPASNPVEGA